MIDITSSIMNKKEQENLRKPGALLESGCISEHCVILAEKTFLGTRRSAGCPWQQRRLTGLRATGKEATVLVRKHHGGTMCHTEQEGTRNLTIPSNFIPLMASRQKYLRHIYTGSEIRLLNLLMQITNKLIFHFEKMGVI